MAITNALKFVFLLILFSSLGFAQEIPFDTNVPETSAGTGAEEAQPPQTPADNSVENNSKTPPPSTVMPPVTAPSKAEELNGASPPTNADNPPLPPVAAPKATRGKTPAELAGLGKLAPFSDIAVITKRFLPKTRRFEFFPNLGLVMNDAFFSDFVIGGRLGFYFTENWGIEASGMSIGTSNKNVTNELKNNLVVQTQALSTPNSFFGADVKWDPIYGKVAFMNDSIIPFDFYFSGGGGVTGTSGGTSAPTLHLGAGQLFAIAKWAAARWDISWYGYTATSPVTNTSSFFTNLHATIGMSFFFPGAEYR